MSVAFFSGKKTRDGDTIRREPAPAREMLSEEKISSVAKSMKIIKEARPEFFTPSPKLKSNKPLPKRAISVSKNKGKRKLKESEILSSSSSSSSSSSLSRPSQNSKKKRQEAQCLTEIPFAGGSNVGTLGASNARISSANGADLIRLIGDLQIGSESKSPENEEQLGAQGPSNPFFHQAPLTQGSDDSVVFERSSSLNVEIDSPGRKSGLDRKTDERISYFDTDSNDSDDSPFSSHLTALIHQTALHSGPEANLSAPFPSLSVQSYPNPFHAGGAPTPSAPSLEELRDRLSGAEPRSLPPLPEEDESSSDEHVSFPPLPPEEDD